MTGVALLVREVNPALSPAQVKTALTTSAVDWGAAGPDNEYGWGRLDAYAAIRAAGAPIAAPPAIPAHAGGQATVPFAGGSVDVPVTVSGPPFPFAATVVAPGWSSVAQTPDFDLTLLTANGRVVASGSTPALTEWLDRRRQEELAVAALAPGAYTLRVTAMNGSGTFLVDISGGIFGTPSPPPPQPAPPPPAPLPSVATPPIVGPGEDGEAPVARALASSGRRGRPVKLFYRASDSSGRTSERIRVWRAGRVLRTVTTPLSRREAGRAYSVSWRARRRALRPRFCVRARDAAGIASAPSCAPLRIR